MEWSVFCKVGGGDAEVVGEHGLPIRVFKGSSQHHALNYALQFWLGFVSGKNIPIHVLTMILIILQIQLTSGCVFTYKERSNQMTAQCVRAWLPQHGCPNNYLHERKVSSEDWKLHRTSPILNCRFTAVFFNLKFVNQMKMPLPLRFALHGAFGASLRLPKEKKCETRVFW